MLNQWIDMIAPKTSHLFFGLSLPVTNPAYVVETLSLSCNHRNFALLEANYPNGCGSKIGTQNGTLASGSMDRNLWPPVGLVLTHTQVMICLE